MFTIFFVILRKLEKSFFHVILLDLITSCSCYIIIIIISKSVIHEYCIVKNYVKDNYYKAATACILIQLI